METRPFAMRIVSLILQWLYCSCTCSRQRKAIRSAKNTNFNFSSGEFWTHIMNTKENTNSYSNTPTLLSTAGSVPQAEPSTTSLVDLSSTFSKVLHLQLEVGLLCEVLCVQRQSKEPRKSSLSHIEYFSVKS